MHHWITNPTNPRLRGDRAKIIQKNQSCECIQLYIGFSLNLAWYCSAGNSYNADGVLSKGLTII